MPSGGGRTFCGIGFRHTGHDRRGNCRAMPCRYAACRKQILQPVSHDSRSLTKTAAFIAEKSENVNGVGEDALVGSRHKFDFNVIFTMTQLFIIIKLMEGDVFDIRLFVQSYNIEIIVFLSVLMTVSGLFSIIFAKKSLYLQRILANKISKLSLSYYGLLSDDVKYVLFALPFCLGKCSYALHGNMFIVPLELSVKK